VADEPPEGEPERPEAAGGPARADPISQYLEDIHDVPLLTAPQEVELAQRMEQEARGVLAEAPTERERLVLKLRFGLGDRRSRPRGRGAGPALPDGPRPQ
jgi:DNA-directed RNA polymerase sigma subunit (sigma70/sigma32)